jgi:hypothetical protein
MVYCLVDVYTRDSHLKKAPLRIKMHIVKYLKDKSIVDVKLFHVHLF